MAHEPEGRDRSVAQGLLEAGVDAHPQEPAGQVEPAGEDRFGSAAECAVQRRNRTRALRRLDARSVIDLGWKRAQPPRCRKGEGVFPLHRPEVVRPHSGAGEGVEARSGRERLLSMTRRASMSGCRRTGKGHRMYEPTLGSLNSRPAPPWYDEAKFGIFIHWGVFAVPAFAPHLGTVSEVVAKHYDKACALTPYSEWYWNAIKTPGTPSAEFHRTTYGAAPYEDFREAFMEGVRRWDPDAWAEAFQDAGARYVVLVTKHHDGFCLWPTDIPNGHQGRWRTERDVVGELAEAVRRRGMRFGVYYSGGFDWTFNRKAMRTLGDVIVGAPGGDYPAYAEAQARELIERYQPSVLWNDISWPDSQDNLFQLFADYYNQTGDGVVNDRWVTPTLLSKLLQNPVLRGLFDGVMKLILANTNGAGGIVPPVVPHSDFRTPEYASFSTIQPFKWEATRGMTNSFGFNRNDTPADYATFEDLLTALIEAVACNGNLLLNVGPRADATIPEEQLDRLKGFGAWLRANGEAIYGSCPWTRSDGVTADGKRVRFTTGGGRLNMIFLDLPSAGLVVVKDVALAGDGVMLNGGAPVRVVQQGPDVVLTLAEPPPDVFAPVISAPLSS